MTPTYDEILALLGKIESLLVALVAQRTIKEKYTTGEVASILGKARFTVREWCRHGRVRATKMECGRGKDGEWTIDHEELTRYRNEGLLPDARVIRQVK